MHIWGNQAILNDGEKSTVVLVSWSGLIHICGHGTLIYVDFIFCNGDRFEILLRSSYVIFHRALLALINSIFVEQ